MLHSLPYTFSGEEWREIASFSHYEVSNFGRVRSTDRMCKFNGKQALRRGVILAQSDGGSRNDKAGDGYAKVTLYLNGKKYSRLVHNLVFNAFVGRSSSSMHIRHLDGNKLNNYAENLKLGTAGENARDRIKHGTQPRWDTAGHSKLNITQVKSIFDMRSGGMTQKAIATKLCVSEALIQGILKGRIRKGQIAPTA